MQILRGSRIPTTTIYLQLLKSRYAPALSLFYFCRDWCIRMLDIIPNEKNMAKAHEFHPRLERTGLSRAKAQEP